VACKGKRMRWMMSKKGMRIKKKRRLREDLKI